MTRKGARQGTSPRSTGTQGTTTAGRRPAAPEPEPAGGDRWAPGSAAAQTALDVSLARVAIMFRLTWLVVIPLLMVCRYETPGPPPSRLVLIVVALSVWGLLFAAILHRRRFDRVGRATVVADALLYAAGLALAGQVLPARLIGDNTTWLTGGASIAIFLVSWVTRPVWTVAITAAIGAAYLAGIGRAGVGFTGGHYQQAFVFLLQGGLAVGILRLMRRGAAVADATLVHLERARAGLSVERARLRSRRALERTLHDTALSTLTAIARGGLADRPAAVRARCARDLIRLEEIDGDPGRPRPPHATLADLRDLRARIALEVESCALSVQVRHHRNTADEHPLPESVTTALVGAIAELLSNVERHAGVETAEIDVWAGPEHALIVVQDPGVGFDPAGVEPEAIGLRRSVHDRLGAVGGNAQIRSAPGRGTIAELRWDATAGPTHRARPAEPAESQPELPTPSRLSEASTAGLTRVLVVIAVVWHLFCGSVLVAGFGTYRYFPLIVVAWVVILAVVLLAARRPREHQTPTVVLGSQMVLFLAAVAALAAVPAADQLGGANWVVADIGWPLAVLAIHRPLREYLLWNAGVIAVFLGFTLQAPGAGMGELGKAVAILLCAMVLQIGGLVAHGVLRGDNARAEEAVRQLTGIAVSRETLAAATQERYRWRSEIGASLRPLVLALADGTADPADRNIRSRCAIEASRLRAAILVLSETGEHSRWRRGVVEDLTRAALARGSTLDVRIAPEFGSVVAEVRGELVNTALAALPMSGPGSAVVTLSGPVADDAATASVTVLFTLPDDGNAVRDALAAMLDRVQVALPDSESDVEEIGEGKLWLEVRSPA